MSTGRKRLLAYIIMVLSVTVSVKLVKDIIRLWNVDDRLIKAEKELSLAKGEKLKLEEEISKVESGEIFEKQIRNTLKMARLNEEVVIIPDKARGKQAGFEIENEKETEDLSNFQKWQRVFGIMNPWDY